MNAKISQAILAKVNSGASLKEAVDQIFGKGTYAKIASDVYDALKAK